MSAFGRAAVLPSATGAKARLGGGFESSGGCCIKHVACMHLGVCSTVVLTNGSWPRPSTQFMPSLEQTQAQRNESAAYDAVEQLCARDHMAFDH